MLYPCHFRFSILLITAVITLCLWIQPRLTAANLISNRRKDSCIRRCGNVDVLYPFGIGTGCFYNESFAITCNSSSASSSSSHVPVLKALDLEVLEISFVYDNSTGVLAVKTPLVTTCRGNNTNSNSDSITGGRWTSPNMSGTPFNVYEYYLIFATVGCDGYAELYNHTGGFVVGCSSVCDPPLPKGLDKTDCIGYGCCQRELDYYSDRGYTVSVKSDKRSTGCRSAFLISKQYYFGAKNASNMTAIPLQLRWNIDRVHQPSHGSFDWSWAIYAGPTRDVVY
uniref:Wall-associated receptor kinase galacturonan-binding domain-containing protein n=1 Tax=Opuntia streptacantha TaxID=393608 RepID=A0A7C9E4E9_OPUST